MKLTEEEETTILLNKEKAGTRPVSEFENDEKNDKAKHVRFERKIAEDDDAGDIGSNETKVNGNVCLNNTIVNSDNQCIPVKNLRKPIPKKTENLTPLTSSNQNSLVAIVAVSAGIAFGYDLGIADQISTLIKSEFNLTCDEKNVIFYTWLSGVFPSGFFGGCLIDRFGRRWMMILSLIFLTFGSMLSALANHYTLLLVARFICGISGTVSAIATYTYMVEVSETNKRGKNVILHQVGVAIGYLQASVITASKAADYHWRFVIGITAAPALFTCIVTIIFLHRSPTFLLLKSRKSISKTSWMNMLKDSCDMIHPMVITVILILQQGLTGRQPVLYYAPRLFALLGICSNVAKTTSAIALGVVNVFSTVLSLIIVERCGRRTALITSTTICMTTISLLSLLATIDHGDDTLSYFNPQCKHTEEDVVRLPGYGNIIDNINGSSPPFPLLPTPLAIIAPNPETWTQVKSLCETQNIAVSEGLGSGLRILAVITVLVYEAAYALGLGPVPFLIISELFPAAVRGKCISFSVIIYLITRTVSESIHGMIDSMTLGGVYLFYSFVCLITIVYIFLFIPETRGKSLHQMTRELRKLSLTARIGNNLRSLPVLCHLEWIKNCGDGGDSKQSTLI